MKHRRWSLIAVLATLVAMVFVRAGHGCASRESAPAPGTIHARPAAGDLKAGSFAPRYEAPLSPARLENDDGRATTILVLDKATRLGVSGADVTVDGSVQLVDQSGLASFPGLAIGVHSAVARAPGYGFARKTFLVPSAGTVVMELAVGAWIRGFVEDDSGRRLSGIPVALSGGPFLAVEHETTATDGSFTFEASAGHFSLEARKSGLVAATGRFRVLANQTVDKTLVLKPGLRLWGRVVANDGGVVASATVSAAADGALGDVVSSLVDESGRFELAVGAGTYDLHASAPGFTRRDVGALVVAATPKDSLVLVLDGTGALTGTVRSALGTPLTDVAVSMGSGFQSDPTLPFSLTDSHGRFALSGVPAERQLVLIVTPPSSSMARKRQSIYLLAGQSLDVSVELDPVTTAVVGDVTGLEGSSPVLGMARSRSGETWQPFLVAADGSFAAQLAKGEWSLSACKGTR